MFVRTLVYKHLFETLFSILWAIYLGVKLLDHVVILCLSFWPLNQIYFKLEMSAVQSLSRVQLFVTSWTAACQASLASPTPRVYPNSYPLSQWCHPTISSSVIPAFNLSQHQGLFKCVGFSYQLAKVLELQLQHQSFQWIFRTDFLEDGLVGSPCSPRDSQESSPTPQFKSINSSVLCFLYSPTLTSIHDYCKNHSLD